MSASGGGRSNRSTKPKEVGWVIFFGEDDNDRDALRKLMFGLLRNSDRFRAKPLRRPISLVKGLDRAKQVDRVEKVAAAVRAVNILMPVKAVVFHQDADDCEPAHVEVEEEIKRLYSAMPGTVIAAVPAWELEAWWFLFPSAVGSVRESWRAPDHYIGKNVGKIKNAKERLAECIRPAGDRKNRRFPEYQESDSLRIAERIVAMGLIRAPSGRSERVGRALSDKSIYLKAIPRVQVAPEFAYVEVMRHGGEICLLRDLYRAGGAA